MEKSGLPRTAMTAALVARVWPSSSMPEDTFSMEDAAHSLGKALRSG